MRVTDNRYTGEMKKFDLAVRMIGHEARTGTIRSCTGFTEDRIRKICYTYFRTPDGVAIRRRRGKSPRQIARFVNNARRQVDATAIACLLRCCDVFQFDARARPVAVPGVDRIALGARICQAFESYLHLAPKPLFTFEWVWNLHHALVESRELYFAWCAACTAPYVQDAYALDYQRCPVCETKDRAARSLRMDS